jgi:hypothetical protein
MKLLLTGIVAIGVLGLAIDASGQSAPTPPAIAANPAAAAPVATSKRYACRIASQGKQGQEQQDQMQLCVAQARLDCLKQAIDQKIVGPQRRDFVKNCME